MQTTGVDHLRGVIVGMKTLARSTPATAEDLAGALRRIYADLFSAKFDNFNVSNVHATAPDLLVGLQGAQQALRDAVEVWDAHGLMREPVPAALRDLFRVTRYARDIVGEIAHGHPRLGEGETTAVGFTGPDGYLELNPRFSGSPFRFEPGDVILERGMAHNSAAIARIGDVDSQFSHVAMVARGDRGEPVIVEALIEEGSVVTPVHKALSHNLGRAVLFRHRDADLALRASDLVRDHIRRHQAPRILYDFSMQPDGYKQLFCAKLVRLAFAMASTADVLLPSFPTKLDMKNRDFVERIGVTAKQTFAPGDMELEPEFDVVAEWRDYRITSELRLKDMIMTKLFEWMELHDYRFRPTVRIQLIGTMGRLLAHMPDWVQEFTRKFVAKVPPNMTASAIGAVAMLHETAEELYGRLKDLENQSIARHGRQLHPREVLEHLDRWQKEMGDHIGYLRRA